MPQLDISTFASQIFWLAISFVVLYLLMAKVGLPRVGAAIEARRRRREGDLDRAAQLRREAEAVVAAYESARAGAREQAQTTIRETTERLAAAAAERQRELAAVLAERTRAAEREIAAAKERALADIRGVAADVAASVAAKLIGSPPDEGNIAAAVDRVIAGARRLMGLFHEAEFWFTIAVLIFVVILWKPAKKYLIGGLDARAERIRQELAAASNLREEAERTLASFRIREREAAAEAEQIIAHAKAEAERIAAESARDDRGSAATAPAPCRRADRAGGGEGGCRNPRGHGRCRDFCRPPASSPPNSTKARRGADRRRDRRIAPAAALGRPQHTAARFPDDTAGKAPGVIGFCSPGSPVVRGWAPSGEFRKRKGGGSMALKIYGVARSRAFRTLWMAGELGLPYEHVKINFTGDTRRPDYLAINPNGHVPAIDDDGFRLWESMAINLYLAKKYGSGAVGLYPQRLEDEARAWQWSFWGMTEVERPALTVLLNRVGPEDKRDAAAPTRRSGRLPHRSRCSMRR